VRNENVRLVLSRVGDSEDSMVMKSKIDGNFFSLPKNHKTTTECFVKEMVVDQLMGYYKHFA